MLQMMQLGVTCKGEVQSAWRTIRAYVEKGRSVLFRIAHYLDSVLALRTRGETI